MLNGLTIEPITARIIEKALVDDEADSS